jgi:hypothetical protein
MGGAGSGNRYHWWRGDKKTVVEECLDLDANRWMREGILKEGVSRYGSWEWIYRGGKGFTVHYEVKTLDPAQYFVRLSYSWVWTATKQQESVAYYVHLTTTRPRFGGLRWWFICSLLVNGLACSRRVGKLYLPPSECYFGCRHCYDLSYTSCQESHKYDSLWRFLAKDTDYDFAFVKRTMERLGKRKT